MTVAVVSAIFGGYDKPSPPLPQSEDCSFTLVTDRPGKVFGWDVVVEHSDEHPRMASKWPKLRPWEYAPLDAHTWVWIDGAFQIRSETFVAEAVAASDAPVSMWAHPWRDCLYDEAEASVPLAKYATTPVLEQAEHYRAQGFPEHAGLWAAGLIVYRKRCTELADAWQAEMERWGYQDQISLPVALASTQTPITALPYGLHQGPWLLWRPHRSHL